MYLGKNLGIQIVSSQCYVENITIYCIPARMFHGSLVSQILYSSVNFQNTIMPKGASDAKSNFVMKLCCQNLYILSICSEK